MILDCIHDHGKFIVFADIQVFNDRLEDIPSLLVRDTGKRLGQGWQSRKVHFSDELQWRGQPA